MAKLVIEIDIDEIDSYTIKQVISAISEREIHNLLCNNEPIDLLSNRLLCGSVRVEE